MGNEEHIRLARSPLRRLVLLSCSRTSEKRGKVGVYKGSRKALTTTKKTNGKKGDLGRGDLILSIGAHWALALLLPLTEGEILYLHFIQTRGTDDDAGFREGTLT